MNETKVINDYISQADWRVKENSNTNYSYPGLQGHLAQTAIAKYCLDNMYKGKIAEAHKRCFIHIHDLGNGMIGYSFYGKNVILIQQNGETRYTTLETLFNETQSEVVSENGFEIKYLEDTFVLDVNKKWTKLIRVLKHKKEEDLVEIISENGNSVIVTKDHPFYVVGRNDYSCPRCDNKKVKINRTNKESRRYKCQHCQHSFLVEKQPSSETEEVILSGSIDNHYSINEFNTEISKREDNNGYLYGLFLSEGWFGKTKDKVTSINIGVQDEQFAQYITNNIDNNFKTTKDGLRINNTRLATEMLIFGSGSENKIIPYDYDDKTMGDILSGLVDGDGTIRISDNCLRTTIRITSYSLLQQMQNWLTGLGVKCSLINIDGYGERECNNKIIKPNKPLFSLNFTMTKDLYKLMSKSYKYNNIKEGFNFRDNIQYVSRPITNLRDFDNNEVYVYDITTETHSFIVDGFKVHNCAGWSMEDFLRKGFNCDDRFVWSDPPEHFDTALSQMNNFIFTMAGEWAGAQALNSIDTYLAPFIKEDKLEYLNLKKIIKRNIKSLVYNLNIKTRIQMQAPFSNSTLDITVPKDLKNKKVIVGGRELDYTYSECQEEMDLFNEILTEVLLEGDAKGKPFTFPIPTYNVTKNFPWDTKVAENLFTLCDEIGSPYLQNFISSDLNPDDVRSMCCRLSLDLRELRKNTGGLFGSGDFTGSLGVVTTNLSRIGYMSKKIAYENKMFEDILEPFDDLTKKIKETIDCDKDKKELMIELFYIMLEYFMNLSKESLIIKRKVVQENFDRGMMPYTKRYLPHLANHFNTIGVNAGNECLLNMFGYGIDNEEGINFTEKMMDFALDKLSDYQEEYKDYYKELGKGLLFNYEASPSEGAGTRFAIYDLKDFGDIITANGKQLKYYTNSTQLPQDYGDNIFDIFEKQNRLQPKYTSGTVQHAYLNEPVHNWRTIQNLVKKLFTHYKLPYISISPDLCICPIHGKLPKTYKYCPYEHTKEEIKEVIERGGEVEEDRILCL